MGMTTRDEALKAWGKCGAGRKGLDEVARVFRSGNFVQAEKLAREIRAKQDAEQS